MTTSLNVSGTWKTLSKVWINVSGTWKECTKVWLNVGGTWKEVFSGFNITNPLTGGSATSFKVSPTNAYAGWRFNTDGTIDKMNSQTTATFNLTNNQQWFQPTGTAPATYYIRATVASGTGPTYGRSSSNPTVGTIGSWEALSTERSWYSSRTLDSSGGSYSKLTIEIASDSGGTNIVTTGTFDIEVEIEI